MKRVLLAIFGALLLSSLGFAAENPNLVPREWIINCQSANAVYFNGTYESSGDQHVNIRMADGLLRSLIAGHLDWRSLAYVQRVRCQFPKNVTKPNVTGENKLLIDLSVDDLAPGNLTEWKNNGAIGGTFKAVNTPPTVQTVDGRKAVNFYYGPWNLPLEYQSMMADFVAPDVLAKNKPFTVAAWLYNPSQLGVDMTRESVLSWHTINGDDGTDIGYGSEGRYAHEKSTVGGAFCGPYGGFGFPDKVWPAINQWHHIAYVFSGERDGSFKLYIDGKLASDRTFNRSILIEPATNIGKTEATINADLYLRDGKSVAVTAMCGENDIHYLRDAKLWGGLKELGQQGPGKISAKFENLKPGTRYYYRFVAIADNETRWSDYAGSFVTASDSAPGKMIPQTDENYLFLGSSWGSLWDWASRPRWQFTGSMAGLKVYSGMLSSSEIAKLYGGPVVQDDAAVAKATDPVPADKAVEVSKYTYKLKWKPTDTAAAHTIYVGADRKSVEDGTTPWVFNKLAKDVTSWQVVDRETKVKYQPGKTYYWRVDEISEDNSVVKGDVWSFTMEDYFQPEFDGLVSEPFPSTVWQNGYYGKLMEGWGQPVIAAVDCPDEYMRLCAYTMAKAFHKRPDVVEVLEALYAGSHLDYDNRGWGGTEFTLQTYGSTRTFSTDPTFYWGINIMAHENGHQFHIFGAEHQDADFQKKLYDVFWTNKKEGLWIGDYGGFNMWEYMACAISQYNSDGADDDLICRRETFRRTDPRMFYFLQDYWPGDMLIELNPAHGIKTDATGKVTSWDNNGGLEYWGKFGLNKYTWSTGSFEPIGAPKLATVKGVSAVTFAGKDALVWNKKTNECLVNNYAWSAEFWAYRAKNAANNEVLLSWGPADNGARLIWGNSGTACDLGQGRTSTWKTKLSADAWHHIVYTFKGGGLENGKGKFCVYVDGRLDHTAEFKLDIPSGQPIIVGGADSVASGYTGALANIRVYDYDISDLQLKKHYKEEASYYGREPLNVAGTLLVDLDARQLAPSPVYQERPTYPASTGRDWVRSWYNCGTLAGKMQNDKKMPEGSDPRLTTVNGITALEFTGNDRMVSSFVPSEQMLNSKAITIEAWVYRNKADKGGIVLQLGSYELDGTNIPAEQWKYVTLKVNPSSLNTDSRLHLGASWDGGSWIGCFNGAIAQVRIHSGNLTQGQAANNQAFSDLLLPSNPGPLEAMKVVSGRNNRLRWNAGVGDTGFFDVYLTTDAKAAANAKKADKSYLGRFRSGGCAPVLQPGKTYYWKVVPVDTRYRSSKVWSFSTYGGLLVNLDASKLANGKLASWQNTGKAGGKFNKGSLSGVAAPVVETWEGRKCVNFHGGKSLVSSFQTPSGISGSGDFSVSVWVYNQVLGNEGAMLAWGKPTGAAQFNYTRSADYGAFKSTNEHQTGFSGDIKKVDDWHSNAPLADYWNHIVYTYSDGVLRIYTNGILNTEKAMKLDIQPGAPISLASVLNENGTRASQFSGRFSDIEIYDYALSKAEANSLYDGTGAKPDASKMLVKLNADSLTDGVLSAWKNQGNLGGDFKLPDAKVSDPIVETIAGRKAVTFDGSAFMQSDITTPAGVTRIKPVTMEAWVYNPQIGGDETFFSLAPVQAYTGQYMDGTVDRALEMRYGTGDAGAVSTNFGARNIGWLEHKAPEAAKWHHIAFVYDGNHQGWGRVYVDGKPNTSRGYYTICTNSGLPMFLGTAWNTDLGSINPFSGSVASLKVYDYAKTAAEISAAAAK